MDSLTQISLGAAIGEAVLGRKVGNRAMLWGAIGGIMPDLDTVANLVTDPISGLAYHRAITHSFLFAVLVPPMLGWVIHRIYSPRKEASWFGPWILFGIALTALLVTGALVLPMPEREALWAGITVSLAILCIPLALGLREANRKTPSENPNASWRGWTLLLFLAIVTHPLLDTCTTFGTQLFQPFADTRAGWDNISVVDPLYTLPLLIGVLLAFRLARDSRRRMWFNVAGILLSSAYMALTFYNKSRVDTVFENSLAEQGIEYSRYMTSPTLFNNVLWQGVAESDSTYHFGYYSLFDQEARFDELQAVAKDHELLDAYAGDRDVQVLQWFSNGYYSVEEDDGRFIFNDLRFGSIDPPGIEEPHYVFKFELDPESATDVEASQEEASRRDLDGAFDFLWNRIWGR